MDAPLSDYNITKEEIKKFFNLVYKLKGIDLNSYRLSFVCRRLRIRMLATKSKNYQAYVNFIKAAPLELDKLFDALAINVTEFFRDPEVFGAFRKIILPELIQKKKAGKHRIIRVWSAGCASGEEAYSLAILISEEAGRAGDFWLRVWGTDMDNDALEKARKAEYSASCLKSVDKEILEKYFIPRYNTFYQIGDKIRNAVKFRQHNLLKDAPLRFMDIIFCRNVMIYLNRREQDVLFDKFYHALNSRGYLVVGQVETLWNKGLFIPVDSRKRIYQKAG